MPMSRRRKLLLLLVGAPLALVLLLIIALLTPAVQTFAARKALADQGSVERVAVGTGGASLSGLIFEQPGLKVSVPSFRADIPVLAAARGSIDLRGLVAHDVQIDVDPIALAMDAAQRPPTEEPPAEPPGPFEGVLKAITLPELRVNGLDMSGVLRVSGPQPLTAEFALSGGGVAAGESGRVELKLRVKPPQGAELVSTLAVEPTLDAAGQLSALLLSLQANTKGEGFLARPASLRGEALIARAEAGESWKLRLIAGEKAVVELATAWAPGAETLPGTWTLDLADEDLAPYVAAVMPLLALPDLQLAGSGEIFVRGLEQGGMSGSIRLAAADLDALGLPPLGAISGAVKFDVQGSAEKIAVNTLDLELRAADAPVLSVVARQPFSYGIADGRMNPSRPDEELVGIRLLDLPASWLAAFVPELSIGKPVRGEWTMRPDGDGFVLESSAPLMIEELRYGSVTEPVLRFDRIQIEGLRAKQGPAGLDAEIGKIRVSAGGADVVTMKVNASQKTGSALVARGDIEAKLAALVDQPVLRGQTRLSAGRAIVTFEASVADAIRADAELRLVGLRAEGEDLPDLTLQAKVGQAADGTLTATVPVVVSGRKPVRGSDIELSVSARPEPAASADASSGWNVVAKLSSQVLHLPDLQAFAAVAAETPATKPAPETEAPASTRPATPAEPAPTAPAGPLWAGVTGELEISLLRIVHAPGVEILDTAGRVALTKDALTLEKLNALLGTGGAVDVAGALRWLESTGRYTLAAEVKAKDIAAGPVLKALDPAASVPLEGTYGLEAKVNGQGADPAAAAESAAAELRFSGREGVLRTLAFNTNKYLRTASTVAGLAGLAGALSGNSEVAKQGARVSAVNNVVRQLSELSYDELSLVARRGEDGAVEISELLLKSPSILIEGSGALANQSAELPFWREPLALNLEIGARSSLAQDFVTLGAAKPLAQDAAPGSYAMLIEPVAMDGTLLKVGTEGLMGLLSRFLGGR